MCYPKRTLDEVYLLGSKSTNGGRVWDEKHIRTVRAETQVHAQPSSPLRSFSVSFTCVQLT
jgi:hypothetical protein